MKCFKCGKTIPMLKGNLVAQSTGKLPARTGPPFQFVNMNSVIKGELPRFETLAPEFCDDWTYLCDACLEAGVSYWIQMSKFLCDPIDRLAQLAEKIWFDGTKFARVFSELRARGGLAERRR
jgi:hypothetical protein